ncbi:MAG: hypothetical protein HOV87_33015 [Catenulispora sp.]|nr:hypothetical protein [Catenulispora sp.]
MAFALFACSSSPSKPPLDGASAAQSDRTYLTATLQALGLPDTPLRPAYFTGNNHCGGPNDDQGEINISAYLGMLSPDDGDRLVTKARDFWKSQGYKIETFTLRAPTSVDNSQTPPAPSKNHTSKVEADANGFQLSLGWTDDPLPKATANASITSSSPCATKLQGTG